VTVRSRLRAGLGVAAIALAVLVLLPSPRTFSLAETTALPELLDPALRVPFAAVLLRAPDAALTPGERVLGLRRDGDPGLVAPRDLASLTRALTAERAGARVVLEVHGPRGARSVATATRIAEPVHALAAQWPACLAAAALVLFALACILGGRHPVATPLFAVSLCLGVGIGSAIGLVLPGDAGLLDIATARARVGLLAWCALPAALLHLAARFPVVVPSFRRPALAAAPYALWTLPALVAQVRFGEPAAVDAVERLALAASFLAGAILAAVCAFPGRRLTPVERTRARAALVGLVVAGVGPLLLFVRARQPGRTEAALVALATLALPLALGASVVRHQLLEPPRWLRRAIVSAATAAIALVVAAVATSAAWDAAGRDPRTGPAQAAALALATALAYQGVRSLASRLLAPSLLGVASERMLVRASRELAGLAAPEAVLARLGDLLREELRPGDLAIRVDGDAATTPLAERGVALWKQATTRARVVATSRSEDPAPDAPEIVLALAPRAVPQAWIALAPRRDGLPYAPEELRALEALARLAELALGDAAASADLEARVADRTRALRRACDDRGSVVEAAARIQAASGPSDVCNAVLDFLERTAGGPVSIGASRSATGSLSLVLAIEASRCQRLAVGGLDAARMAELEPHVEAVEVLAGLALERIHLLAELKEEVERQAGEIARRTAGEQRAVVARQVAHELRKPAEEIRDLAAAHLDDASACDTHAFGRIEAVAHELLRRLDCLLAAGGRRFDPRPVDLVAIADEALARVARRGADRAVVTQHAAVRLPLVADATRIASLIENLLDNAWKATAPGGRVVLRTALARRREGPAVVLEVEDDGGGVPPELGNEIFEPGAGCFREGFGLGLTLCRDVAAAHGGAIEVESAPGRTVFRVELPQLAERIR